MIASILAFALILLPQTAAPAPSSATSSRRHKSAVHAAAPAKPAGPATPAELEKLLTTDMQSPDFHGDAVTASVSGADITLRGVVHQAEHKGLATRDARKVAEKAGWKNAHVLNQLQVALAH